MGDVHRDELWVSSATLLEVALALDNTGSMSNNMDDLKTAAKNLVQTVLNGGGGAARVSIVPYVAAVNPGLTDSTSISNYIDTTALNPWVGNWERYAWLTWRNNCSLLTGDRPAAAAVAAAVRRARARAAQATRDIFDILKTIRHLAQETLGVTAANADVTAATAPAVTAFGAAASGYLHLSGRLRRGRKGPVGPVFDGRLRLAVNPSVVSPTTCSSASRTRTAIP